MDRGTRVGRHLLADLGRELREARIGAGLSQAFVGQAIGVSHTTVGRIERSRYPSASLLDLARLSAVLALDLSVRVYPSGDPLRDSAQLALLERLRHRLHPDLTWRTEVPLPIPCDRRAWDAVIRGRGWRIGVEAETRLRDVQATARRIGLKARDGEVDHFVLLLGDTKRNREELAAARKSLRDAFPMDMRVVLARLGAGEDPGSSGIVIL
ncbi:MAG: helix-turn-helix transcriptional regulator [Candidatus Limnocylindrales bacterium]